MKKINIFVLGGTILLTAIFAYFKMWTWLYISAGISVAGFLAIIINGIMQSIKDD
jgi:xanthine/uracil permease